MPWSVNIGNWGGIPMWHLISYLCPLIKHTVLLLYVLAWFKEVFFFFHVSSCYKDSMGPPGVGPCFTHKTGLPGVPLDARSFCTKSLSLYYTRWQWISIFYLTASLFVLYSLIASISVLHCLGAASPQWVTRTCTRSKSPHIQTWGQLAVVLK